MTCLEKLMNLPDIGKIIQEKEGVFSGSTLKIISKEIKPILAVIHVRKDFYEAIYQKLKFSNFIFYETSRKFPVLALGKIKEESEFYLAYAKYLELKGNSKPEINEICILNFGNINDYYEFPNFAVSIM